MCWFSFVSLYFLQWTLARIIFLLSGFSLFGILYSHIIPHDSISEQHSHTLFYKFWLPPSLRKQNTKTIHVDSIQAAKQINAQQLIGLGHLPIQRQVSSFASFANLFNSSEHVLAVGLYESVNDTQQGSAARSIRIVVGNQISKVDLQNTIINVSKAQHNPWMSHIYWFALVKVTMFNELVV